MQLATRVVDDFQETFHRVQSEPAAVYIDRRGHPMFISAPGVYTRIMPDAGRPMDRVFFANTDSVGPVSTTDDAIVSAREAVEHVKRRL